MKKSDIPCHAFSARHASRTLSQFYERRVAPSGIHTQQLTILAILKHHAPMTVLALAQALEMDRTTLAHNLRPLQRDGIVSATTGKQDKRNRIIALTEAGAKQLDHALTLWRQAQTEFEDRFGAERAAKLREELRAAAEAAFD